MKKGLRILTTALALTLSATAFASCKDKNKTVENSAVLFDFNDDDRIASLYYLNFAKVTVNTDTAYITEGNGSFLLEKKLLNEVDKSIIDGASFVEFHTGFAYEELFFDELSYVSIDVYNPQENELFAASQINTGEITQYKLKSGWNTLYAYVDREALTLNGYDKIERIRFYFDQDLSKDDPFKVYLDNLRTWKADEAMPEVQKEAEIGADSLYEFKYVSELTTVAVTMASTNVFDASKISINREERFLNGNETSMKVAYQYHDKTVKFNSRVTLSDYYVGPKLRKYVDVAGSYLQYNIFNDSDYDVTCHLMLNCELVKAPYLKTFTIPAHSWLDESSSRLMLADLKAFCDSYSKVDTLLMDVPDLKFNFVGLMDGTDLYFDAIKVVKGGE